MDDNAENRPETADAPGFHSIRTQTDKTVMFPASDAAAPKPAREEKSAALATPPTTAPTTAGAPAVSSSAATPTASSSAAKHDKNVASALPPPSVQCPSPGMYYIRTYHNTFLSARPSGDITTVLESCVGSFERFEVQPATPEELQTFVNCKSRQKHAENGITRFINDERNFANQTIADRIRLVTLAGPESYANRNDPNNNAASSTISSDRSRSSVASNDRAENSACASLVFSSAAAGKKQKSDFLSGSSVATAPAAASYVLNDLSSGQSYPVYTVRAMTTGRYLSLDDGSDGRALSSAAAAASAVRIQLREKVGASSTFTLRPHPRLRPEGIFFMLRNELFETNIAAIMIGGMGNLNNTSMTNPLHNPSPNAIPSTSNGNCFNSIQTAADWCGFEFIPIGNTDSRFGTIVEEKKVADILRDDQQAAAEGSASDNDNIDSSILRAENSGISAAKQNVDNKDGLLKVNENVTAASAVCVIPRPPLRASVEPAVLAEGIYTVTAFSTNARLAFVGNTFIFVAATDVRHSATSSILSIRFVKEGGGGEKGALVYSIANKNNSVFAGLEKQKFHTRPAANPWERWVIEPHPTVPLHYSIRSKAFGDCICCDPCVKGSSGMVMRTAENAAVWEAFYFGKPLVPV